MEIVRTLRSYDEFCIVLDLGVGTECIVGNIQPSGAVYLRWSRGRKDAYIYDHNLDRVAGAYGGFVEGFGEFARVWGIPLPEMRTLIDDECLRLRNRNDDWDVRYAPGSDFSGNEFCS